MNDRIQSIKPAWDKLGIGPGPDWLDEEQKRAWDDLAGLAPPGEWVSLFHVGVACMAVLVVQIRSGKYTDEDIVQLAEWMADYLLGPEHFMKLLGFEYAKPWPDPTQE